MQLWQQMAYSCTDDYGLFCSHPAASELNHKIHVRTRLPPPPPRTNCVCEFKSGARIHSHYTYRAKRSGKKSMRRMRKKLAIILSSFAVRPLPAGSGQDKRSADRAQAGYKLSGDRYRYIGLKLQMTRIITTCPFPI